MEHDRAKLCAFYVYKLVDPQTGVVFYVGKGTAGRAWSHEAEVRRGKVAGNLRKIQKIQTIVDRGQSVEIEFVATYDDEIDAYEHEIELISADPTLTNIMPGGGRVGILTAEQIAKQAAARRVRLQKKAAAHRKAQLARLNKRRFQRFSKIRGVETHADEVKVWLQSIPPITKIGHDPMAISSHEKRLGKPLWTPEAASDRHSRRYYGCK